MVRSKGDRISIFVRTREKKPIRRHIRRADVQSRVSRKDDAPRRFCPDQQWPLCAPAFLNADRGIGPSAIFQDDNIAGKSGVQFLQIRWIGDRDLTRGKGAAAKCDGEGDHCDAEVNDGNEWFHKYYWMRSYSVVVTFTGPSRPELAWPR